MAHDDRCVVAEYANHEKAQIGLKVLDLRGFDDSSVSVISRDQPGLDPSGLQQLEEARIEKAERPSQAASGGLGAALAGGAAVPVAVGTMLPPLYLLGPIVAAVAGATAGGIVAGTKKLGLNEQAAQSYAQRLADGSVLVIVQATGDDLLEALAGLKTTDTLSLETFAASLD